MPDLKAAGLDKKALALIGIIRSDPFRSPPPYEKLLGDMQAYSRRINLKHRLVYEVDKERNTVKIISMWPH
ncbi:MAG: Txe/YoeB family addiction module toxin [Synergistes jonesii]|uniref:Txe/YoeB family addiction module toxin n=1 Tax=Synergistes jonesii TaxID=2754 RepID=UPI002A7641D2|nr:Txe/YoeB family addiction module toxin [Synergistes jonesii]MDY2985596.1 Txe/YoeB family addiction module toxin [Synergistes jonesii]